MLKDKTSSAIVAVDDLDRANTFYADTLGLEQGGVEQEGVLGFKTGDSTLVVYKSNDVRPGTGNAVAWGGGSEVEAIANDLRAKGIAFEEYPEMGMEIVDGVHKGDGFVGIWFKDPDGNILHVNSM